MIMIDIIPTCVFVMIRSNLIVIPVELEVLLIKDETPVELFGQVLSHKWKVNYAIDNVS